ncbi:MULTISPECIES: efflux RND transporter periplasmic adaptor subunit [Hyphobacterium]|uniref:Efflux RND transporter periplasmic adaptor subunit n=1 Tax=Hyphobacterium vulgare TaxID=1736751 RepID=A0ABV6ZWL8_9PROT
MMKRLAACCLLVALATGCSGESGPIDAPGGDSQIIERGSYRVYPVSRGDIVDIVPAVGEIQAAAAVEVGAEVSGTVAEILVDFDAPVEAGQLLARIDPAPFEAALRQAEAQLAMATADRDAASAEYDSQNAQLERIRTLTGRGAGSTSSLQDREFAVRTARADLARAQAGMALAQARVEDAQFALGRTEIRAPIDGFVLERRVEAGQVVNSVQTAPTLFVIAANLTEVVIEARVAENDVGRIEEGMRVRFTVDAYPDEYFEGESGPIRRAPIRTGRLVSYPVEIRAMDPGERLLPGMTASVEFVHSDARSVLRAPIESLYFIPDDYAPDLPEEALRMAEERGSLSRFDSPEMRRTFLASIEVGLLIARDRARVFVLESGSPAMREISVGIQDLDFFEIADGEVEEGDLIIVGPVDDTR